MSLYNSKQEKNVYKQLAFMRWIKINKHLQCAFL